MSKNNYMGKIDEDFSGTTIPNYDLPKKRLTRNQAIKAYCLECSGGNRVKRKLCHIKECNLWVYRLGPELDKNGEKIKSNRKGNAEALLKSKI